MLFLSSVPSQPDPVALIMVLVLAVIVAVMALRKRFAPKKSPAPKESCHCEQQSGVAIPQNTAPGSAGKLKLHDVEPKTAAMLMAIVADQMGKPLNELRFISIQEVK